MAKRVKNNEVRDAVLYFTDLGFKPAVIASMINRGTADVGHHLRTAGRMATKKKGPGAVVKRYPIKDLATHEKYRSHWDKVLHNAEWIFPQLILDNHRMGQEQRTRRAGGRK